MYIGKLVLNENGEILELKREFYRQGYIYKNWDSFNDKRGVCYVPETSDTLYTYQDFLDIAGNEEQAKELFSCVDWQHPEVLMEDWEEGDDFFE